MKLLPHAGRPLSGSATSSSRRPPAALLVFAAIVSVQFGGALAATLLPMVGVWGSVTLRLVIAALVLLALFRPRLRGHSPRAWFILLGFATSLAVMNATFYGSLTRLPIGVAVTIEFLGPLTLAAAGSRRTRDLLAVLAAAVGVILVSGAASANWRTLDHLGVALALAAGGCWAAYIVLSKRTGAVFPQVDGIALAMALAALMVLPFGVAEAGSSLLSPDALWRGAGIALLSSAIPYSLELVALRRLSSSVFGILMSLEPAMAALAGLLVLSQRLAPLQLLGMACVMLASALVLGRSTREAADSSEVAAG